MGRSSTWRLQHGMLKEIFEQPDALRQCITGANRVATGVPGGLKLSPLELSKLSAVRLPAVGQQTRRRNRCILDRITCKYPICCAHLQ